MEDKLKRLFSVGFWLSLLGVLALIFDFGFSISYATNLALEIFYLFILVLGILLTAIRYYNKQNLTLNASLVFDLLSISLSLIILNLEFFEGEFLKGFYHHLWFKIAIIFTFIREFSEQKIDFKRTVLNPAQLFMLSFVFIILFGTFLLMLPKATQTGISFIDALFTATSAVCVTGLIVVDTSTYFTFFGQLIIMFLIQIGGLGILTFASYFSYFFKGGSSYENHLVLSDLTSSNKLSDVFSTLKYILLITFSIEITSAILIYSSIDSSLMTNSSEKIFFSAFHATSAFCNAGFSTLKNNIYEEGFKVNYYFQLILIGTFVFGGLGFPIIVNVLNFFKYKLFHFFTFNKIKKGYRPWVLNINSRITLITTFSITLISFIAFFVLEYHHILSQHDTLFGKLVTALFGATTPRTAGFNTFDFALLSTPTLIMIFVLMWIGASPSSTGGGIKTSTVAILFLNILSLAQAKNKIEIYRREISSLSVSRAFAIVILSLMIITLGFFFISIFDPQLSSRAVAFECFSAYSTVGLSLGITALFSAKSKFVLVVIMFLGRISMLTVVIAIFKRVNYKNYSYPLEELTIN